ncbi:hypothetical protein HDE78_002665 [Rhodanobacter sp. K2T2]|nr:hypothetical protein [Rhodanobacter sp. K2T2]
MESGQSTSIRGTAQAHWRSFMPAWFFPFVFFYGGGVSDSLGYPTLFFLLIALPLFFWTFFRATRPYVQNRARYWPCVFLGLVVPFFLGIVAVGSRLALLGLLSGSGKA